MKRTYRIVAVLAAVGLLVAAFSAWASYEPEWLGVRYVVTDLAGASNGCDHDTNLICVEWCDVYQGQTTVPRGILCCVDQSQVGEMVVGVPCLNRATDPTG